MTRLPDLTAQIEASGRRGDVQEPAPVGRCEKEPHPFFPIGAICLGTALIMAAVGIWAVPAQDNAVVLLKIGASLMMFFGGVALIILLEKPKPWLHAELDLKTNGTRCYERDREGQIYLTRAVTVQSVSDLSLRTGVLQARDRMKQIAASVPVRGRSKERALRKALSG